MNLKAELLKDPDSQGRPRWELLEDYVYHIGPGCDVTVPAGYVSNMGTVPRFFHRVITPGEMREASVVHDWMCNERNNGSLVKSGFTRWMADVVLYEHLRVLGFGCFRCLFVFAGVRFWAILKGLK